jgi:hypothetical protein
MWIPHRVFFGNVAIVSGVALGLLLLVWVARRPAGVAPRIVEAIGGAITLCIAYLAARVVLG